jgi:hypothetical protein
MVVNALLRGGERINFWQVKSGYLGDARDHSGIFDFWYRKKGHGRTAIVDLTKELGQHDQVLLVIQSFDHRKRTTKRARMFK